MLDARPSIARLRAEVALSPAAILGIAAVAVFAFLEASHAGFAVTTWYPAGLLLLGLLLAGALSLPLARNPSRPAWVAVALLWAYAGWCFLSISWAAQQGDAWDGANRAALYAAVFTLFALWPIRASASATLVGSLAVATILVGAIELVRAATAADPRSFFIGGRFAQPAGYPNANVALWFAALLPCTLLGSRREVAAGLRALFLGGSVLLLVLALMGQSRGWLFALPFALVAYVAISPNRTRSVLGLLCLAPALPIVIGPALHVYDAAGHGRDPSAALHSVVAWTAVAMVVVAAIALAWSAADRRVRVSQIQVRRAGAVLVAAVIIGLVGALAIFTIEKGSPVTALSNAWGDFKHAPEPTGGTSRFGRSLGSNRYDFWRVAWAEFGNHPLGGVGVDNFQQDYLAHRHSPEEPRYPHSLELRMLAQTGIVGFLLLGGALAAAIFGAIRASRRRTGLGAAAAAAAASASVYWLIHGSVDWFWEFPGLAAAALALLGLACGIAPRRPGRRGAPSLSPVSGTRRVAAVTALSAVLALSFAGPWISQLYVNAAAATWNGRPGRAMNWLDRASWLNPLSPTPKLVAGTISLRLNRVQEAQREFAAALTRSPRDAYAHLELGAIASQQGRRAEAVTLLERASRLNPRDEITATALRRARTGERLNVAAINSRLLARANSLTR